MALYLATLPSSPDFPQARGAARRLGKGIRPSGGDTGSRTHQRALPPSHIPRKGWKGRSVGRSVANTHTHLTFPREFLPLCDKVRKFFPDPPLLSSKSSARISPNESEFRDSSVFGAAFARSDYLVLCTLNPFPFTSASVFGPKFPPTNAPIPPPPDLCTPNWTPTQFVARNRA